MESQKLPSASHGTADAHTNQLWEALFGLSIAQIIDRPVDVANRDLACVSKAEVETVRP